MCIPPDSPHRLGEPIYRRGFTIIEMLVTIGIIGIVVSILLPALSGGIGTARRTVSLSNLRTIGQLTQHYADASKDAYPWATRGVNLCGIAVQFSSIWGMRVQWPLAMNGIIETEALREVVLSPGARRDWNGPQVDYCMAPPSYAYSLSFIADPRVWNGDGIADESMLHAVTLDMVTYPASKTLMWDWELPYVSRELRRAGPDLDEPTPMLFTDGHGADHRPSAATDPVENPFIGDGFPESRARLHNTRDGVRGLDY